MTDAGQTPELAAATAGPPSRPYQRVILALALLAMAALLGHVGGAWSALQKDVGVYWQAGLDLRAGGESLYAIPEDTPADADMLLYVYPPAFAAIFAFLTLFPPEIGMALWAMLLIAFILISLRAVYGICGGPALGTFSRFCFAMLVLAGTVPSNLYEGQINLMVTAATCVGLWMIAQRRSLTGGAMIGLAFHLKVIPIVLLGVLAVQGRWRACLGVGLGLVLFYFTPLIWTVPKYGVVEGVRRNNEIALEYFVGRAAKRVADQRADYVGGTRAPNVSLSATLRRYFEEGAILSSGRRERGPLLTALDPALLRWTATAVAGSMFLLALALAWRKRAQPVVAAGAAGLALTAAHLASLPCWPHHLCSLVLLAGPVWALGQRSRQGGSAIARPMMIAIMVLLALGTVVSADVVAPLFRDGTFRFYVRLVMTYYIWGVPTLMLLAAWTLSFVALWRAKPEASEGPAAAGPS